MADKVMPDGEFVHAGMRLTKLVVNALAMTELDQFVEACKQQIDDEGDEAAVYALQCAAAAVRFRDEVRELSGAHISVGAPT